MSKFPTTDEEARRLKLARRILKDVRTILRDAPKRDEIPVLSLSYEKVKAQLTQAGHEQVLSDVIVLAFESLEEGGLIEFRPSNTIAWWDFMWISPDI